MTRPDDTVKIEAAGIVIDRATQFEISNSFTEPAQALVEFGDENTWKAIREATAIGAQVKVWVNGRLRLAGRMLSRSCPISTSGGATVRLTVRTVLADAAYASADPGLNVSGTTLKQVLLKAYAPLGLAEKDFLFNADTAVDILTGKGKGARPVDLADIQVQEAKPHPPESIYAFVARHLERFHWMHWDAPDGRIVVGAPSDTQEPIYQLRCFQDPTASKYNNVLSLEHTEDYEAVPSVLGIFGQGGGQEYTKASVRSIQSDPTLIAVTPDIYRRVILVDEAIKTQGMADARALKEMSARSMAKDGWRAEVDGLAYWTGSEAVPWAIDTVADVQVDAVAGGASGPYLVTKTTMRGNAQSGCSTQLELVAKGIWRL